MLKCQELKDSQSCLNKAGAAEPIFVIRAKDLLAAQTVRLWASMAVGEHEKEKVASALELADQMEKWRAANVPHMERAACEEGQGTERRGNLPLYPYKPLVR